MVRKLLALCALLVASAGGFNATASPAPLTLTVYDPGAASVFPVTSVIVAGVKDVVLVDAQFQTNDAEALVKAIKATGKRLTVVYVSHSDPDYYFGLGVIHAAFPHAAILATAPTVAAIKALAARKLAYWGPVLGANAPKSLIIPKVLNGDHLTLEGRRLDIVGLDGPTPARSFVWIPSLQTVLGGAILFAGTHVWVADTPSFEARAQWRSTLARVVALHPLRVIPGHSLGPVPPGLAAVSFDDAYLTAFDQEAARAQTSAELIKAMERRYPDLPETAWLELGAKVVKGEMRWPQ
ncbi:MAG: MBL fold metallo-hydrolase [Alphaproteobacteria bacterium]|jgi:glyoxylase-like metal-dependent hydrolase (beta-lactamase superfamily II)|nr:MBL fold metallo-hydrolase [Alphaproteobacteria bacterium]